MHVVDALNMGGTERVAVDLANLLPRREFIPFLCTTRNDGPFARLIAGDVGRLSLKRKSRFDTGALERMVAFIRSNRIRVLHAHGSALFFARLAALFPPHPLVVWHDHYGRYLMDDRPGWLYRAATRGLAAVIAVNEPLAEWSRRVLRIPSDRVYYIPNSINLQNADSGPPDLPGSPGARIVCVANLRPQKDHSNLIRAMAELRLKAPQVHLLLVGESLDLDYRDTILAQISQLGLGSKITYLGARQDVAAILRASDIGVLSSESEGLPLALLEYGMCGLPVVATKVGQCGEVLDHGAAGILVLPSSPQSLADALFFLLSSPESRARYGERLRQRVQALHSPENMIRRVCEVYEFVLGSAPSRKRKQVLQP